MKNWSALGPDLVTNFWWKKFIYCHTCVYRVFLNIINNSISFTVWYTQGRTTLIPKDDTWTVPNQRPITCTNTMYKWFSSIILSKTTDHLYGHGLMQLDQRGGKANCSGTFDNLLIDNMVIMDAQIVLLKKL